ncbi:MAG: tRNA pseudouridine(38-40) synthase TruA [Propionicimonas sp.]|uniref:tRNA pseudouridine(38-40) synthase TruA n=1 Tax=Propionicimonas sp. TaxID=1955623 RepID=UPI002B1FBC3C|nr:tRNA pseudouridine(38-40) synthase TruA [Propionicimonas sp.]MEA4943269.1 tRNA pseudouridine(38-40) synthase TruA [Propionicimonas sp.]MEA5054021.1 tRNA pseudouridine(38-40) synthase TruA [Propionicimonas sp.]
MVRYRLDIAYDGAGFHGWAAQTGLRTVQGELELWLQRVLRLPQRPELVVAGRTDAGVHARGQVAHVDLPDDLAGRPAETAATPRRELQAAGSVPPPAEVAATLQRRLRRALPEDLVVSQVRVAPDGFDARFSAIWRRYVYRLTDTVADPLHRGWVVKVRGSIDLPALNQAGHSLVGLHDFAAFCRAREGATTIRQLQSLQAVRVGEVVELTVQADAFCHSMVRSLVGALVEVGTGRRDAGWLAGLVDTHLRSGEVPVMPAAGLVLEEVGYPPADQLAARAQQARAHRSLPGQECT